MTLKTHCTVCDGDIFIVDHWWNNSTSLEFIYSHCDTWNWHEPIPTDNLDVLNALAEDYFDGRFL